MPSLYINAIHFKVIQFQQIAKIKKECFRINKLWRSIWTKQNRLYMTDESNKSMARPIKKQAAKKSVRWNSNLKTHSPNLTRYHPCRLKTKKTCFLSHPELSTMDSHNKVIRKSFPSFRMWASRCTPRREEVWEIPPGKVCLKHLNYFNLSCDHGIMHVISWDNMT